MDERKASGRNPEASRSIDDAGPNDLIAVLGSVAVNDRVRNRVLKQDAERSRPVFARRNKTADELSLSKMLQGHLERLFVALVDWDQTYLSDVTTRLIRREISFNVFYREVAVPLANKLGEAWIDDSISMMDVEFASSRLTLWCEQYAAEDQNRVIALGNNWRIVLARTQGEAHTLGLSIAARCFAHAGWEVHGGAKLEAGPELFEQLSNQHFDAVGLSVGSSVMVDECTALVKRVRAASKNKRVVVSVGGPAVIHDRERLAQCGADILAEDALEAMVLSEQFAAIQ